jgi:carboxyl-terminal processing protease
MVRSRVVAVPLLFLTAAVVGVTLTPLGTALAQAPATTGSQGDAATQEQAPDPTGPEAVFEHAWRALDRNYAQFGAKGVDWDALYDVYRPMVTPETTDEELWDTILTMTRHLNDGHVCLQDTDLRLCGGPIVGLQYNEFSRDLVVSDYLAGEATTALDGSFVYGWLPDNVGYIHIADFKDGAEETEATIDAAIELFANADAIIVDVRHNPGGTGAVATSVAGRFADRKRHFMTSWIRYGRDHGDLISPTYWNVEPEGPAQFARPTLLLTHRLSESAADIFALAMRVLPNVMIVGDSTVGALSSQYPERLPNGWRLWVAYKLLRDHNGVCWDGIGVPPDLFIKNTAADIEAGTDRVLEFAQRLIASGDLATHEDPESLRDVRTSLVKKLLADSEELGTEAAIAAFREALHAPGEEHFMSADEAMPEIGRLFRAGKSPEATALLEACREECPQLAGVYPMLARAYLGNGNAEAALEAIEAGEFVEPMLPWEEGELEVARNAYLKHVRGSAADEIAAALEEGGTEAAAARFSELLATRETGPVFDERDFNNLGYGLLQDGDNAGAIFVFEKNVELYPQSANVYDSLGEAYMTDGQNEKAVENYTKVLELSPGNLNALEMLERIAEE